MVGVRWLTVGLGLWFPTLSAESRPTDEDLSVGTPGQAERMGHGASNGLTHCEKQLNGDPWVTAMSGIGHTGVRGESSVSAISDSI